MAVKKSNVFSMNLSDKAVASLQQLGFLDGRKQAVPGKNISKFVSERLVDYLGIHHPRDFLAVKEKLALIELNQLQKDRDRIQDRIQEKALEVTALRTEVQK